MFKQKCPQGLPEVFRCPFARTSHSLVSLRSVCLTDPGGCESGPEICRGHTSVPLPWALGRWQPPSGCPGCDRGAWQVCGYREPGGCRRSGGDGQKPRARPGPERGGAHYPAARLALGSRGWHRIPSMRGERDSGWTGWGPTGRAWRATLGK